MLEFVPRPSTWDQTKNYFFHPYHLVPVPRFTAEFSDVENHFVGHSIEKIERVQNPFQYGKFILFQLQKGGETENTMFMPTSSEKLKTALRYNCDYRRLNYGSDQFYESVQQLLTQHQADIIIVLKTLNGHPRHDAGRYPQYVVSLNI